MTLRLPDAFAEDEEDETVSDLIAEIGHRAVREIEEFAKALQSDNAVACGKTR